MVSSNSSLPPFLKRCPKCGSEEIQRSRRKNLAERALGFAVLPWRCTVCYVRFYRPTWKSPAKSRVAAQKATAPTKAAYAAARGEEHSLGLREKILPGFIKRNPMLMFFVPARRKQRHMQHAMPFGAKQFRSRPIQQQAPRAAYTNREA